jgi:hypothetical protein
MMLVYLLLGVILLAGGVFVYLHRSSDPIPKTVRQAADFELYYPYALPDGWKLDKNSFETTQDVVLYTLKSAKGNIVISEQKQQAGFNYSSFYQKNLSSSSAISTPIGSGAIGRMRGNAVGSISIDNSWILASANTSKIGQSDIQFIFYHLKK